MEIKSLQEEEEEEDDDDDDDDNNNNNNGCKIWRVQMENFDEQFCVFLTS